MPKKRGKQPGKKRGRPRIGEGKGARNVKIQPYSEAKLRREHRARGIVALAKRLSEKEVEQLKHASLHVETDASARKTFARIASKYNVALGDLEQALLRKAGPEIRKADIYWWKKLDWLK